MTEVRETKLPGVGVRHEFTTGEGQDLGVIVHHDGRREILAYDDKDPDTCATLLNVSEHDTQTLAEILGISHVSETVGEVRHEIDGLGLEWVELTDNSPAVGQTIAAGAYRSETGATIVAVIRNSRPVPSPGPDFTLSAGDVAIAVGNHQGLTLLRALLTQ